MTYRTLSPIALLIALFALASFANAGIITHFDAGIETNPSVVNVSDENASIVNNTGLVSNSTYNTRSFDISNGTNPPNTSGIIPDADAAGGNGLFFVMSSETSHNTNFLTSTAPYHEFTIEIEEDHLGLDTLSYNYWVTDFSVVDPEEPSNFTYETRVRAQVKKNGQAPGNFELVMATSTDNKLNVLNQNTLDANGIGTFEFTPRSNVVEFDLTSNPTLAGTNFEIGDEVTFQIGFADYVADSQGMAIPGSGPNDNTHVHRLDNVILEASSAVPEPSALCLLLCSFGFLGLRRRR